MNADKQLAADIRQMIVSVYRILQQKISNPDQLSVAAQNVMYQLTQKDKMLPSELCTLLNISSQYISQVFNQLEALEYISREPSKTDGRKTWVLLTKKGKQKVLGSRTERETWLLGQLSEKFSASEKKTLQEATMLLSRLSDKP